MGHDMTLRTLRERVSWRWTHSAECVGRPQARVEARTAAQGVRELGGPREPGCRSADHGSKHVAGPGGAALLGTKFAARAAPEGWLCGRSAAGRRVVRLRDLRAAAYGRFYPLNSLRLAETVPYLRSPVDLAEAYGPSGWQGVGGSPASCSPKVVQVLKCRASLGSSPMVRSLVVVPV